MDLNLTVIAGQLAATPEIKEFENGTRTARLLITVRSTEPKKRIDVIPVVWWAPNQDTIDDMQIGDNVWVAGSVQRRFWLGGNDRRSKLEVVAHEVTVRRLEEAND